MSSDDESVALFNVSAVLPEVSFGLVRSLSGSSKVSVAAAGLSSEDFIVVDTSGP